VDALRSGSWLDAARQRRLAIVLAIAYVASWAFLLSGPGRLDPLGRPVGVDFALFYGMSAALLGGVPVASLYSPEVLHDVIREWTVDGRYVLLYPPTALLLYAPLALLPYLAAIAVWTGAGLTAYVASIWPVLRDRAGVVATLLFPAVYVCISNGHNGLVHAGFLGGALVLLPASPIAAGVLFGVLAMLKPHLALLLPVALLASRRWRTLVTVLVTTAMGLSATVLALGPDALRAFLGALPMSRRVIEEQAISYATLASVFSAARLLGASVLVGYAVQGLAAIGAIAVVVWTWRREHPYDLQVTVLLLAGTLVTPYLYDYDLPVLGLGLATWARSATASGWRAWERSSLFAVWLAPLLARPLALATRIGLVPLVVVIALTVIMSRVCGAALDHARAAAGGSWPRDCGSSRQSRTIST
jgi:hypothetical protein